MLRRAVFRFSYRLVLVTALALVPISLANASSDIGYTICRGKMCLTIRFGMVGLYEAQHAKNLKEKVAYAEVSETGRSFTGFLEWFAANKALLQDRYVSLTAHVEPDAENCYFYLDIMWGNGEDIAYSKGAIPYRRGRLVEAVTREIDTILKIKSRPGTGAVQGHLVIGYFPVRKDPPDGNPYPEHMPAPTIRMGAYPGGPMYRRIGGSYKIMGIYWADDPAISSYRQRAGEKRERLPLEGRAIEAILGTIE